ncbi:MAG: glycosyltransferase family 9 protein [Planctomycetes bacterium]|nr:glycosyltransferase family 9 protein [Planctomycetota bacterium]
MRGRLGTHERIVLVRLSHLGDVLHALPVFHALAAQRPSARLAWVIQREYAELVRPLARLERVFEFDRGGGARAWLALREELASFAPTRVIDAQGNLKSAAAALVAGSGERLGLAWSDWRERLGAFAMHAHAEPANGKHAVDRMLALARSAARSAVDGEIGSDVAVSFDLELSADEHARGRELAIEFFGDDREPVVLTLATPDDVRAWPEAHSIALARALASSGRRVLVLSGPAERESGARVERELTGVARVRHWVGQRGLRELASLFAAVAERGGSFVGCDSGPLHLAWSSGVPVTCLAGPQDARRTGPWPLGEGSPHRAVVARERPSCAPCLSRRCDHPQGNVCMRALAVEDVLAALARAR